MIIAANSCPITFCQTFSNVPETRQVAAKLTIALASTGRMQMKWLKISTLKIYRVVTCKRKKEQLVLILYLARTSMCPRCAPTPVSFLFQRSNRCGWCLLFFQQQFAPCSLRVNVAFYMLYHENQWVIFQPATLSGILCDENFQTRSCNCRWDHASDTEAALLLLQKQTPPQCRYENRRYSQFILHWYNRLSLL